MGIDPSGNSLSLSSQYIQVTTDNSLGYTIAVLTFLNDGSNGVTTSGGNGVYSLGDGIWDLQIDPTQVTNAAGNLTAPTPPTA